MGIVKGDCFGITITRAETIIAPATEQCFNRAPYGPGLGYALHVSNIATLL